MASARLTLSRVIKKESTYGDHRKTTGTGRSSQPASSPGSPHAGAAWHPHAHRLAGLYPDVFRHLFSSTARHRYPDIPLSVVFQLVYQRDHRDAPGTCSAYQAVTWRWGSHLLIPGTDCLSARSCTDGHLHRFSPGRRACGRAGTGKNGGCNNLLCAACPMDSGPVRDLHRSCLFSACCLIG